MADRKGGIFVMYNCARLSTLLTHFDSSVERGVYPACPPLEEIDFRLLREEVHALRYMHLKLHACIRNKFAPT